MTGYTTTIVIPGSPAGAGEVFDFSLACYSIIYIFAQDGTSVTGYTTTIVIPGSPPAGAGTAHGALLFL